MDASTIATRWRDSFGAFEPVGYVCRDRLRSRWLRIHSLPHSKRYPDTESEYEELLRRHNEAATTLLGTGEECVLFVASFLDAPGISDRTELSSLAGTAFVDVPDLSTAGETDDMTISFEAAVVSWKPDRFNDLIRAVADERAGPVLFANLGRHTAYAPYDGGADLFCDSQEAVVKMKVAWQDWLSARVDGL